MRSSTIDKVMRQTQLLLIAGLMGSLVWASGALAQSSEASFVQMVEGEHGLILSDLNDFIGSGWEGDADDIALKAELHNPQGVAVATDGSIYIADTDNHQIRRYLGGKLQTVAGVKELTDAFGNPIGSYRDGGAREAAFHDPAALALDAKGNVYIADAGNHAIRKLSPDGSVATLAGNGVLGATDGTGKQASFYYPQGIAVAPNGTVYVADSLNHLIRQITPEGKVSTLNSSIADSAVAGTEVIPGLLVETGGYMDGGLQQAQFNEPSGLALDAQGNLYVSDSGNHLIRYIDLKAGTVSTVAGYAPQGKVTLAAGSIYAESGYVDGSASEARFNFPRGLAVTGEGGLLIADSLNHTIRYLFQEKVVTIAGDRSGARGWHSGIESVQGLHLPTAIVVTTGGKLLIADSYNNRVRELTLLELPQRNTAANDKIRVVAGSPAVELELAAQLRSGSTYVPVRDLSQALGYKISFQPTTGAVVLQKDGLSITLKKNEAQAKVARTGSVSQQLTLPAAPYEQAGVTYAPLRVLAELVGLDIQWHQASKTVIIREGQALGREGQRQ